MNSAGETMKIPMQHYGRRKHARLRYFPSTYPPTREVVPIIGQSYIEEVMNSLLSSTSGERPLPLSRKDFHQIISGLNSIWTTWEESLYYYSLLIFSPEKLGPLHYIAMGVVTLLTLGTILCCNVILSIRIRLNARKRRDEKIQASSDFLDEYNKKLAAKGSPVRLSFTWRAEGKRKLFRSLVIKY